MMRQKKNNIIALFGFKKECVKLFLFLCADVLIGIKEAIAAAFPRTEYQRCIVHQVRNTLKFIPDKDRKKFASDLKTIYQALDEKKILIALEKVTEKWSLKYLKYQIKTQNYIL